MATDNDTSDVIYLVGISISKRDAEWLMTIVLRSPVTMIPTILKTIVLI